MAVGACAAGASDARAQTSVYDGESVTLGVSGYLRTLTGVHDAGFDPPDGSDPVSGFHGAVGRLRWRADVGSPVVVEVHQRVLATLLSSGSGPVAGFDVTVRPGRAVDLSSHWVDSERLSVVHDVERAAVTIYAPFADLTVGRQAVTWGWAALFPVADLWAAFSPFELDAEEKPGVDAVRVLTYPAAGWELDALLADRGDRDELSAGVRLTRVAGDWEGYLAGGRLWDEAMAMAGVTLVGQVFKGRAEIVASRDLDGDSLQRPRVTLGVDRLGTTFSWSAEVHYNGLGAARTAEYVARLGSETFQRGESYYLGRWYLGALASWTVDEQARLRLAATTLVNLADGSASVSPVVTYDLGGSTRVSGGALLSLGEPPEPAFPAPFPPTPVLLESEFGAYGDLGYLRMSVYF